MDIPSNFSIKEIFLEFITTEKPSGEVAEVAEVLATEEITRVNFRDIRSKLRLSPTSTIRDGIISMILFYARSCVKDHELTMNEKENLQLLTTIFQVEEGEFYSRKAAELSDVLGQQVLRIIQDRRLDYAEDLYQSDLQRIFGLSYDQYVELTQEAVRDFLDKVSIEDLGDRAHEIQQIKTAFLISD